MVLIVSCKKQSNLNLNGVYALRNYSNNSYPIWRNDTIYIHNDSLLSSSFLGQKVPFECKKRGNKNIIIIYGRDMNYNFHIKSLRPNKIIFMVNYDNNLYYEKIKN